MGVAGVSARSNCRDRKYVSLCFACLVDSNGAFFLVVLSVASQMVTHMAIALPLFATPAAAGLSLLVATLTRLSISELTWVACLFGPLHLLIVSIMYVRIPKAGSRTQILQGKIGLISITVAPFCIASLAATLYQWYVACHFLLLSSQ
jgi:hypothetical protein